MYKTFKKSNYYLQINPLIVSQVRRFFLINHGIYFSVNKLQLRKIAGNT